MQKITVVCVGKIKEAYYRAAVSEYAKRLSGYCKLEMIELPDEKTPDGASKAVEEGIKKKEGERILKCLRENSYVITLEIQGKMLDSVDLSHELERLALTGKSDVVFVIGGSLGLHESVRQRADDRLSFSKMTFPHQLMRVILLEQIYRSFRIQLGAPYHK